MHKRLRNLVHGCRESKGISLAQMAKIHGYRNIPKGCNKILEFEREGLGSQEFIQKLIDALVIDPQAVQKATQQDYEDWQSWLDEPVEMDLIEKILPGVYRRIKIPEEINSREPAIEFACHMALKDHFESCLALNRRESIWIRSDGTIKFKTTAKYGFPNAPYCTVG